MACLCGIDVIDQRGERGGLAAARRAGDQHQAVIGRGDAFQHFRQFELLDAENLGADRPQHHPRPVRAGKTNWR